MEVIGGIILALILMALLAGLGVAALAGLAIMAVLGLMTEMSFKRLFFVSFGLGLIAPLALGGLALGALEDRTIQEEIGRELAGVFPPGETVNVNLEETIPRLEALQRDLEDEDLGREEIRQRLREVFADGPGVRIRIGGPQGAEPGEGSAADATGSDEPATNGSDVPR